MLSYTRKDASVTTPKSPTKKYIRKDSDYTPTSSKTRVRVYSEKIITEKPKEGPQQAASNEGNFIKREKIGSVDCVFGENGKIRQTEDSKKPSSIQELRAEELEAKKIHESSNSKCENAEKEKKAAFEEEKKSETAISYQYDRQFLLEYIKKQSSVSPSLEVSALMRRKCEEVITRSAKKAYTQDFSAKRNGDSASKLNRNDESASPTKINKKYSEHREEKDNFVRKEITEEEKAARAKIEASLGKWSSQIVSKSDDEALEKKIRFLLNLLTPDNYEKVKVDIRDAAQTSLFASKRLAELLIEKAWSEVKYSKIYAKLCEYLGKCDKLNFDQADQSVPGDKKKNEFKIYLIRKIQSSFNNDSQITPKTSKKLEEMNSEEKEIYQMKKKKLIIGSNNFDNLNFPTNISPHRTDVVFISELFLRNFISRKVILICISSLLSKFFSEYFSEKSPTTTSSEEKTPENHLEALIVLLTHSGKAVEDRQRLEEMAASGNTSPRKIGLNSVTLNSDKIPGTESALYKDIQATIKAKQKDVRLPIDNFRIVDVIDSLNLLKEKLDLSVRIGSLIQNLDQRRKNNWVAPEFHESGPKTLKQVELDFLKEKTIPTTTPSKKPLGSNGGDQSPTRAPLNLSVGRTQSTPSNGAWKLDGRSLIPTKSDSTHSAIIIEENATSSLAFEQVSTELKEIYTLIEEDEDHKKILEKFKRLSEKADSKDFAMGLMKSFNDGKLQQVSRRLEMFPKLLETDIIDKNIFNKAYGECLFELWLEASDFPGIEVNYAKIYLQMVSLGKLTFKGLYIHPSLKASEEKEFILETYNTVIAEMQNLVKSQYPVFIYYSSNGGLIYCF